MALELTFGMIKPDAVKTAHIGDIIAMAESKGFVVLRMQLGHMNKDTAEHFYAEHKERPFFGELVDFITSGPVVIMALAKEEAIKEWRGLMGATNPAAAEEGTIRKTYGTSIGSNAVHGSDSFESAARELGMFFPELFEEQAQQ